MKLRGLVFLAFEDLRASKGRAGVSAAGIGLGVAVLFCVASLGLGARNVLLNQVVQRLPLDTIEVFPKTVDLGLFEVNSSSLLGTTPAFDADALAKLGNIPGVRAAYPKLEVKLPLGARGGEWLFGRTLYTDLFMTGLPDELLQPHGAPALAEAPPGAIPIVVSPHLLEIYNGSVAPSLGTPKLTGETLKGFRFELVVGQSRMLGSKGARKQGVLPAYVVGTSRHAMRLGVSVPIDMARQLLREYSATSEEDSGGDTAAATATAAAAAAAAAATAAARENYASVLLLAHSPTAVASITDAVEQLGFAVDKTAETTADIMTVVTLLGSSVGLLVLLLAALNIAHSFFASLTERRGELAMLRAVGARQTDLVALVLLQAAILGTAGGALGLALARSCTWTADRVAAAALPDFPFKPESFFAAPASLHLACLVAAIGAAVVGAAWPALRTARRDVAHTLASL